jgi:leucyl-tRNA synthetase
VLAFALATAASLLFPFAPHTSSEVYYDLTGLRVWEQPWPTPDPALLAADTVNVAVQVNGKVRSVLELPADADREALVAAAVADPKVSRALDGLDVGKVVVVPGRLVNFVAS